MKLFPETIGTLCPLVQNLFGATRRETGIRRTLKMTVTRFQIGAMAMVFAITTTLAGQAIAGGELVKFPENYAEGVHYATVNRGNIREELFTNREAIEAVKSGKPIPSGTVITLVDYRGGALYRYVVMEKRAGWGAEYPPDVRNGEWEYQAFNADTSVNTSENLSRCFSCHKSQEKDDFVYTVNQMKSVK